MGIRVRRQNLHHTLRRQKKRHLQHDMILMPWPRKHQARQHSSAHQHTLPVPDPRYSSIFLRDHAPAISSLPTTAQQSYSVVAPLDPSTPDTENNQAAPNTNLEAERGERSRLHSPLPHQLAQAARQGGLRGLLVTAQQASSCRARVRVQGGGIGNRYLPRRTVEIGYGIRTLLS